MKIQMSHLILAGLDLHCFGHILRKMLALFKIQIIMTILTCGHFFTTLNCLFGLIFSVLVKKKFSHVGIGLPGLNQY